MPFDKLHPSRTAIRFGLAICLLVSSEAWAERRLAVLVADSEGWDRDPTLQHALDDVRRLEETLSLVGAFAQQDIHVLIRPSTEQLLQTLELLARDMQQTPGDKLLLFYYSGHADQTHLHISGSLLSYEELYERLRDFPAQLKLGILDACQSGGIISKGGRPIMPFDVKVAGSLTLHGTVLLTSSGADELSQEHKALAGSVFSHHLVSGLRGAADDNADRLVSLDEAYRHAYERTLVDTLSAPIGEQRPRLQFNLRGQGTIILTRLEQASSLLELPTGNGRCFVTDQEERRLIAEARPVPKHETLLALTPGTYALKCSTDPGRLRVARFSAAPGERVSGDRLAFREVLTGNLPILRKGTQGADASPRPSLWKMKAGIRGEAELIKRGLTPALSWEVSRQRDATSASVESGGILTVLIQPTPGLRLEGALSPYAFHLSGARQVRLRATAGATAFLPDAAIGGRLGIGIGLQEGALHFSADAAYERIFNPRNTYEPSALLVSLGIGWTAISTWK